MYIQRSLQFFLSDARAERARLLETHDRLAPHFDKGRKWAPVPRGRLPLSDWPRHVRRMFWPIMLLVLLLHVALVIGLLMFVKLPENDELANATPVQLVMVPPAEPPPPPKPKPQEQQKQQEQKQQQPQKQKPPSQGPIASDDLGDPDATGNRPTMTHAPAAGEVQRQAGEAPPPPAPGQQTEKPSTIEDGRNPDKPAPTPSLEQDEMPTTPDKLAAGGETAPAARQDHSDEMSRSAAKAVPKPAPVRLMRPQPGGAQHPTNNPDELDHGEGRKAKYPGPDANRDEYLAYLKTITDPHIENMPPELTSAIHGLLVFSVVIRPSGAIVYFSVLHSSGSQLVDAAFKNSLDSITQFPPLPDRLRTPDGSPFEVELSIPLPLHAGLR